MAKIKVGIAGCLGRMGQELTKQVLKDKNFIYKNIKKKFMINSKYFNEKYNSYLNGNMNYEQYLWNEIMLNISRQNLEK